MDSHLTKESAVFYVEKCQSHVRRTMASYYLAARGADDGNLTALSRSHRDLLADAHEDLMSPRAGKKLRRVIDEAHFLLLKVNFEIFLQKVARLVWGKRLRGSGGAIDRLPKAAIKTVKGLPAVPMTELLGGVSPDNVADWVVPTHGLHILLERLEDVGLPVRRKWNERDSHIWPQISVAFAVRRLIEHRNGRIHRKFRESVGTLWGQTSWNALGELEGRTHVTIRSDDIETTAQRMLDAADALRQVAIVEDRTS